MQENRSMLRQGGLDASGVLRYFVIGGQSKAPTKNFPGTVCKKAAQGIKKLSYWFLALFCLKCNTHQTCIINVIST